MKQSVLAFCSLFLFLGAQAQTKLPRYFIDIPAIYATAPDVQNVKTRVGVGAEAAFNVATHWGTARIGGGSTFTVNPKAQNVQDSLLITPYGLFEIGAGLYRTNGNKCAKNHSHAFTAMAVAGIRYDIDTRSVRPDGGDPNYGLKFGVGAEFGYFFISDVLRNYEIFLRGTYFPDNKTTTANFGFKFFLNARAFGDR